MLCLHDTRFVISRALSILPVIYKERDTNTLLTISISPEVFFAPTSSNSPYINIFHLACFLVSICPIYLRRCDSKAGSYPCSLAQPYG